MIGWENNQGAYFIQKLEDSIDTINQSIDSIQDDVDDAEDDISVLQTALASVTAEKSMYNDDFNNLKATGIYLSTSGSNRPSSGWVVCLVVHPYHDNNGDILWQLAVDVSTGNVFSRALYSTTWSDWKRLAFAT